jgi:hypothetical protein
MKQAKGLHSLLAAIYIELAVPRINARKRIGRCYELAGRGLLQAGALSRWNLVHGTVTETEGLLGHAWLELGGLVYDPVMDFLFTKKDYYGARKAKVVRRYTMRQAAVLMVRHKTAGPWTKTPANVIHRTGSA